jgi:hypothetical protein
MVLEIQIGTWQIIVQMRCRRGRDHMVVGFTTTYVIMQLVPILNTYCPL